MKQLITALALLGLAVSAVAGPDSTCRMYRYVDAEGTTVIDHSIPPEYADGRYDVLNCDSTLVKTVPRAPTKEEIENRTLEERQKEEARKEEIDRRERDKSLLLRYSSIEDIEAARDRALSELKIRISILRSNVRSLKLQVENNQARAADIERGGGTVSVQIIDTIDDLQGEIKVTERSIVDREKDMAEESQSYAADMERFVLLLDQVEMRRRHSLSKN